MSLQQILPVLVALATAFFFRNGLIGSNSRWWVYPIAFAGATCLTALVGIAQFWMPQISMGLGAKGLPLIVFGIVGARAALPVVICMLVLLVGIALFEVFRRKRAASA